MRHHPKRSTELGLLRRQLRLVGQHTILRGWAEVHTISWVFTKSDLDATVVEGIGGHSLGRLSILISLVFAALCICTRLIELRRWVLFFPLIALSMCVHVMEL
jgi:hypothetical protein